MARRAGWVMLVAAVLTCALGGTATGAYRFGTTGVTDPTTSCPPLDNCSIVQNELDGVAGAPTDGVIVRWFVNAAGGDPTQPARLQLVRPAPGTFFSVVAEQLATFPNGGATIPARIPIRRGDRLGFHQPARAIQVARPGSSAHGWLPALAFGAAPRSPTVKSDNTELTVGADIEPDGDADDHGDQSQDLCPGDPARIGACSGVLGGPPLTEFVLGTPTSLGEDDVVATVGAPAAQAPFDGVLTRWRALVTRGRFAAVVVRPEAGGAYRHVAETAATPWLDQRPAGEFVGGASRVPVRAGDVVGLRGSQFARAIHATPPGASLAAFGAIAAGGSVVPIVTPSEAVGLFADFERDADGDGFGDETQDGCPADPSTQGPCPSLPAAPAPPAVITVPVPVFQAAQRTVVRPGTARLAVRRLRYRGARSLAVPLTCPASAESCKGRLELKVRRRSAGKASFSLKPGQRKRVKVKLNARARRALRRGGRVSARIMPAGPKPTSGALTLTPG